MRLQVGRFHCQIPSSSPRPIRRPVWHYMHVARSPLRVEVAGDRAMRPQSPKMRKRDRGSRRSATPGRRSAAIAAGSRRCSGARTGRGAVSRSNGSRYSAVLSLQDLRGGSAREGRPRAVSGRYSEGCLNCRIVADCGWSTLPTPTARSGPQTSIGIPSFNATRRNLGKRGGAENCHLAEIAGERIREAEARRRVRDVRICHFLTLAHAFAERDGTS